MALPQALYYIIRKHRYHDVQKMCMMKSDLIQLDLIRVQNIPILAMAVKSVWLSLLVSFSITRGAGSSKLELEPRTGSCSGESCRNMNKVMNTVST